LGRHHVQLQEVHSLEGGNHKWVARRLRIAAHKEELVLVQKKNPQVGVQCSVAASATQEPVVAAPSSGMTLEESECFGVFCVTYDLKETNDDQRSKTWKKMVQVLVSRAAGMITNHLLFKLTSEEVFGHDQLIALRV
jgi:malate dehydrogenase (NADP+)